LNFNVIAPEERSDAVSVVLTDGCDPDAMRAWCRENCGVVLGHGIGELSNKTFRVAHMGHVNAPMVVGTLSVIEMALSAIGIAHGSGGVQAAITWLARQMRDK
jgi:alanine-glyoxylate transaminase / serine-glyoxylate transaminase / serine-pyruvate transaminase